MHTCLVVRWTRFRRPLLWQSRRMSEMMRFLHSSVACVLAAYLCLGLLHVCARRLSVLMRTLARGWRGLVRGAFPDRWRRASWRCNVLCFVCACMYACMYVCVCVCLCVLIDREKAFWRCRALCFACMFVYICIHVRSDPCRMAFWNAFHMLYVCMCVCMYAYMCFHIPGEWLCIDVYVCEGVWAICCACHVSKRRKNRVEDGCACDAITNVLCQWMHACMHKCMNVLKGVHKKINVL